MRAEELSGEDGENIQSDCFDRFALTFLFSSSVDQNHLLLPKAKFKDQSSKRRRTDGPMMTRISLFFPNSRQKIFIQSQWPVALRHTCYLR